MRYFDINTFVIRNSTAISERLFRAQLEAKF